VLYTFKCILGLELVDVPRYTMEFIHLPARFVELRFLLCIRR
jgi:hypothetical protein